MPIENTLATLASNDSLSTAMHETNAVTIGIMDVHFAIAPALISRFEINDNTGGLQFFMERVQIVDPKKDYSARHSIARKRGNMYLNVVARQTHVTWIGATKRSIGKHLPKTETITVKLFGRG